MLQRLEGLLALLVEPDEDDPPETVFAEAEVGMFGTRPHLLLHGNRCWAVPMHTHSDQDGQLRLDLLSELAALLARERDRPSIVEIMDRHGAPFPGVDERGVPCVDLTVYASSDDLLCPERRALRIAQDSVTRELLTSLVQIEQDMASLLSAPDCPSPSPKGDPSSAAPSAA